LEHHVDNKILYLLVSIILLFGGQPCLHSQDFNFQQINYTVEDGLPSNECHRVLQDSQGYIWIATDRGLVKFDGYEFRTYGIKDGLLDMSCLSMMFDIEGRLWVRTLSSQFFIYDPNTDRLTLYQHQSVIDPYLNKLKIRNFYIDKTMMLTCAVEGVGFLMIDNDGHHTIERGNKREGRAIYFTKAIDDNLLISSNNTGAGPEFPAIVPKERGSFYEAYDIVHDKNSHIEFPTEQRENSILKGLYVNDKISILSIRGAGLFYQNGLLQKVISTALVDVISYRNQFISAEIHNKGIKFYSDYNDLTNDKHYKMIPDISASDILSDQRGDLWISTLSNGLVYLRNRDISSISPSGIHSGLIDQVELGPRGLYFLENRTRVYHLKSSEEAIEVYSDPDSEIRSLNFVESKSELIINKRQSSRLLESHSFAPIVYTTSSSMVDKNLVPFPSTKALVFEDDDFILTAAENFILYDNLDNRPTYYSTTVENDIRVLSGTKLGHEDFLLGTNAGLVRFRNRKIESMTESPEELKVRINDIVQLEKTILFATQGYGLICWDLKNKLRVIDKKIGLVSDNLEDLFLDSKKNNLYVSSNSGLSKLWYDDNDSILIKNYTSFHGLPSNEVNNVVEYKDAIYIATGEGIGVLSGGHTVAEKQLIKIEDYKANGISMTGEKGLSHLENNVEISYKTLDFKMFSKIPYQYRLNEDHWTQTNATSANFPALQPGKYTFQVQSQNIDGIWSESATQEFEIRYPWWRTTTFHILSALGIFGCGFLIYKTRTRQLKDQLKVESEIRDLERSALQAQMNPHFIFNCLNSIQRFIMDNDKVQAMEYLSKFAVLIRQSLNASNQNKISLDEEISMLRNYLELEKLRFKNKFEFKINISEQVIPEEIKLPPLLVQPYVENAVVHGMKEKESEGLIIISFERITDNQLEITVTDNGTASPSSSLAKHKSLGMSITSKRLAYNNKITDKSLKIRPEFTDQGTRVRIKVKH